MAVISVEKYNTIEEFRQKTNNISDVIGDGANLSVFSTSTDVISAIRELLGTDKSMVAVKQVIEGAAGWNMVPSDTTDIPQYITYTKGASTIRCSFTWVDANPTVIAYQFYNGSTYITKLTETITYDQVTGNVVLIGWST